MQCMYAAFLFCMQKGYIRMRASLLPSDRLFTAMSSPKGKS